MSRSDELLRAKIADALSATGAAAGAGAGAETTELAADKIAVTTVAELAGGACQDSWKVTFTAAPEWTGPTTWVLRGDARSSLAGSLDRNREFDVMRAAADAGVKTPRPEWRRFNLTRPAGWSYFVPFLPGEAIGRKVVSGPHLADAREKLPSELAQEAAKIHAITPATHPDLLPRPASAETPVDEALAWLRTALDGLLSKRPAVELALDWLGSHRPAPGPVTLVHGDYRVGNFLVTPEGLSAVLDWEFAHWGSPDEDLAWLCVRDWRFGKLHLPVGGIGQRAPFLDAYFRASGRAPHPESLRWWEIFGNCRWAVGAAQQAERYTRHGESDVELVAIGRRGAEMEWEALRLIELAES